MRRGLGGIAAFLGIAYIILTQEDDVTTSLEGKTLVWPVLVEGGGRGSSVITQEFRPPSHMGVDIAFPGHLTDARASVVALADGTVAAANLGKRGWQVLLNHGDWASGYLHMTGLGTDVVPGARVKAGQVLGPMGADPLDGQHVVHLHLQIAPGGHPVDPARYLRGAV